MLRGMFTDEPSSIVAELREDGVDVGIITSDSAETALLFESIVCTIAMELGVVNALDCIEHGLLASAKIMNEKKNMSWFDDIIK